MVLQSIVLVALFTAHVTPAYDCSPQPDLDFTGVELYGLVGSVELYCLVL